MKQIQLLFFKILLFSYFHLILIEYSNNSGNPSQTEPPHYEIKHEGNYLFVFHMQSVNADGPFSASVQVELVSKNDKLKEYSYQYVFFIQKTEMKKKKKPFFVLFLRFIGLFVCGWSSPASFLRLHVRPLLGLGPRLARALRQTLARSPQNPGIFINELQIGPFKANFYHNVESEFFLKKRV